MRFPAFLCVAILAVPSLVPAQFFGGRRPAEPTQLPEVVPIVTVTGPIVERRDPMMLFAPQVTSVHDLVRTIDKATGDPTVKAMLVRLEMPDINLAQAAELSAALRRFRATEKPLHIYLEMGSLVHYLIASQGTEITMSPVGALENFGIGATGFFMRDLLGKLGMEAQAITTGAYKNAFEPFIADSMSESTREQLGAYLDDTYAFMVGKIMDGRGVEQEKAELFLSGGPFSAKEALDLGAIDSIEYFEVLRDRVVAAVGPNATADDEYTHAVRERPDFRSLFNIFGSGIGGRTPRANLSEKIVVVYGQGPIIDGRLDESNPFGGSQTIASEDFVDLIDEAVNQPNVRALVIRIDSPGGSANASDRVWDRLRRVSEEQNIPVVVSMGSVAASGGYYIGMAGDHVFAEPTTITGSIGVVGGKIALGGTYEKLGIGREAILRGQNASLSDESRLWNEEETAIIQGLLDGIYDEFLSRVATSREMEVDAVRELAGGRIWSGTAAAENGLIDEVGGLADAIAHAREIADAETATIVEYPRELTPVELIEQILSGQVSVRSGVQASPALAAEWQAAAMLLNPRLATQAAVILEMLNNRGVTVLMVGGFGWEITH